MDWEREKKDYIIKEETLKDKMDYYCNDWNIPEEKVLAEAINKDIKKKVLKIYRNIYTIENSKNQNWENCFKDLSKQIKKEFGDFEK
jgi:hypothetical protein